MMRVLLVIINIFYVCYGERPKGVVVLDSVSLPKIVNDVKNVLIKFDKPKQEPDNRQEVEISLYIILIYYLYLFLNRNFCIFL